MKYKVGDKVRKVKGYEFIGEVRAAFTNTNGNIRYVVQKDKSTMLHIYNEDQLELIDITYVTCDCCGETKPIITKP